MSAYPLVHEFFASCETEDYRLEVHRSLRSILSSMVLFFVSAVVVYALIYWYGDARLAIRIPLIGQPSIRWLAMIPALTLAEIVRKYHDKLYVINNVRTVNHEGRLSLNSSLPAIKHEDIRAIVVRQDILGRIFYYGDIHLSSAAQGGDELVIIGVYSPQELALFIDGLRSQVSSTQKPEEFSTSKAISE